MCCSFVLRACLKHCRCFRFSYCFFFTSAVDEHNAVRHTHFVNMYLILLRFITKTNHLLEKSAYFTRHIISIGSVADIRPPTAAARILARTGPFDIRHRQVALLQVLFQVFPLSLSEPFHQCFLLMLNCVFYLLYNLTVSHRISKKHYYVSLLNTAAMD